MPNIFDYPSVQVMVRMNPLGDVQTRLNPINPHDQEARQKWYRAHNCTHAHCPLEHEHPQPFFNINGDFLCGACWFEEGIDTFMIPCVPEVCIGEEKV